MGWVNALEAVFFSHVFVQLLISLLLIFLVARISLILFRKIVERQIQKLHDPKQEKIVVKMETPLILIIVLAGTQVILRNIFLGNPFLELLIQTGIIFLVAYIFHMVFDLLATYWERLHEHDHHEFVHGEMLPLVKGIAKIVFYVIAFILILQVWGVNLTALLTSLGVLGVILGFAFQDTLKNIFGGIMLSMDSSLSRGDVIVLENGILGEVREINFRSTKLRTFNNEYYIIPNGVLANSSFTNYALPTRRVRVTIPVSVAYGSEIKHVKKTLLNTLKKKDILTQPLPEARFLSMGEFSLNFQLIFFIGDYSKRVFVIDEVTADCYDALRKENIEIPFPTRTVYHK